jgi:hypothetical protein
MRVPSLSLIFILTIPSAVCFTSFVAQPPKSSALFSTAETTGMESKTSSYPDYTEDQLKAALESLLDGYSDPAFDGRHLFGFQDPNHKLSKLQAITATRILDYETFLVRCMNESF